MKRTSKLKLTLMLGATAGLQGCGDSDESALLFKDAEECTRFGVAEEECQSQYQQALQNHYLESPQYLNENLCEGDFGYDQCEVDPGDNSIWRPVMAGFMLAMLAEAVDEGLDYAKKKKRKKYASYGGKYFGGSKPLYRSKDDFFSYRNSSNQLIGSTRTQGPTLIKKSRVKYKSKASRKTTSRGGFGSRAASRSSYGG